MSIIDTIRFITTHPLNRDERLSSIVRFARWQIGSRLAPGPVAYDWIDNTKFFVRPGETGLTGNIYVGLHEFADMAFVLHALRENDLFVDVGANAGSYTILACGVVGARGYAFEPAPFAFRRLVENVRLNHMESRVNCRNIVIGSAQGRVAFSTELDATNHVLASSESLKKTIEVEAASLDAVLIDESPTLMKIDVEGYETQVLEGASATLSKSTLLAVIIELNGAGTRYGFDEAKTLGAMRDYGFKTYSYQPLDRTLVDLQGKHKGVGNTLFIRDQSVILERLKHARKFTVHGKRF